MYWRNLEDKAWESINFKFVQIQIIAGEKSKVAFNLPHKQRTCIGET